MATPLRISSWRPFLLCAGLVAAVSACQPYAGGDGATPSRSALIADVNALKGASSEQVSRLLGEPSRRRRDPPAVIWQYIAGKSCVLDVFMYEEESGSEKWLRTAYAQVRAGRKENAAPLCVQTLLDRR